MKGKKSLTCNETISMMGFMTAPTFYVDRSELKKGEMQKTMKKYARIIKEHPITVLRPKSLKLPSLKSPDRKTIIVTKKEVEGFQSGPLSYIFEVDKTNEQNMQDYVTNSKEEGISTRQEFLENLFNGSTQTYSEGNANPEAYLNMSESSVKWDLNKEHGLGNEKLTGITTTMGYIGKKNSVFPMHQEDGDLLSLNIHLGGAGKIWWAVPKSMQREFQDFLKEFPMTKECHNYLRHKCHIINPAELIRRNILVYEVIQQEGDIVVTNGYHMGGNFGCNINIAINFTICDELWTKMLISEAQATNCNSDCKFTEKSQTLQNLQIKLSKCGKCKKSFNSDLGKKQHEDVCLGGSRDSKCPYCSKVVKHIIKHAKKMHKDADLPQICTLCRLLFQNSSELRNHWKNKIKTNRQERKCDFCFKKFRKFDEGMNHHCTLEI